MTGITFNHVYRVYLTENNRKFFLKFHQASSNRSLPVDRVFGRVLKLYCGRLDFRRPHSYLRRRRAAKTLLPGTLASQF